MNTRNENRKWNKKPNRPLEFHMHKLGFRMWVDKLIRKEKCIHSILQVWHKPLNYGLSNIVYNILQLLQHCVQVRCSNLHMKNNNLRSDRKGKIYLSSLKRKWITNPIAFAKPSLFVGIAMFDCLYIQFILSWT